MAKLSYIGLDVMGFPMAGHLAVKRGHQVTDYNRTAARAQARVAKCGGRSAAAPAKAAEGAEMVFACVGDDPDMREIALGADVTVTKIIDGYDAEIRSIGGGRWDTSSLIRRLQK